jgi:hypothetical protein
MFTTDLHGRSAKAVLREDAAHRCALVEQEHGHIFAIGFAHSPFGHPNSHTGDCMKIGRYWRLQMNWHLDYPN